jgi:hypothetical protein
MTDDQIVIYLKPLQAKDKPSMSARERRRGHG